MPDGRVHSMATLAAGTAAVATTAYLSYPTSDSICVAIGFLVGLAVTCDLDLNVRFPRRKPYKWLWWLYWYPYSRMVGHRSIFSHVPLVSTFIRITYLLPIIAVIVSLGVRVDRLYPIAIGLALSDLVHVSLDVIVSSARRWL